MKNLFNWFVIAVVAGAIAFCCIVIIRSVRAQETNNDYTPNAYEYDGWQQGTTLRGNWSGDEPPGANDRLYIYDKNNVKTGQYYEHNGYEWKPKNGAYIGGDTNVYEDEFSDQP